MSSTTAQDDKKDSFLMMSEVPFPDRTSSSFSVISATASTITPKALPDVDDQSMTQVHNYIDSYRTDLAWSFLSDSFFIVGGLGYVFMATWDCFRVGSNHWIYRMTEVGAPSVYLFNSVIDMAWAYSVQQRFKARRKMEDNWQSWRILLDDDVSSVDVPPLPADEGVSCAATTNTISHWIARVRKHAAHRRTMLAAFTFGVAAVFAVASVFTGYFGGKDNVTPASLWWESSLDAVSVHVYLLSAIVAVSGKRNRPWLSRMSLHNPETLEDLGDLLFLIGSSVDVMFCDLSFDDDEPFWPLLSSILWFLDACLYLRADFVMAHRMIVPEEERSGEFI
ncbi:hypothetical protein IV203_034801 [Nitzschia inconspicua]|uniref:Transmembrane protein n=1 Tax=Nitzschia inconspicua TaxID=303405 RepID=A0A9K3LDX2_9STRA|nr:hypothetical protein IV203_034801 [Nitzschia inconspicua]